MRDEWKRTKQRLGGHKCIKHKITGELNISGKYGEIWAVNDITYAGVLTNVKSQRAACISLKLALRLSNQYEHVVRFPAEKLDEMVLAIGAYKTSPAMIRAANSF